MPGPELSSVVTVTEVLDSGRVTLTEVLDVLDLATVERVDVAGPLVDGAVALTGGAVEVVVTDAVDDVACRRAVPVGAVKSGDRVSRPPSLTARVNPAHASAALPTNAARGTTKRREKGWNERTLLTRRSRQCGWGV